MPLLCGTRQTSPYATGGILPPGWSPFRNATPDPEPVLDEEGDE